jgi:hypothetical protein
MSPLVVVHIILIVFVGVAAVDVWGIFHGLAATAAVYLCSKLP